MKPTLRSTWALAMKSCEPVPSFVFVCVYCFRPIAALLFHALHVFYFQGFCFAFFLGFLFCGMIWGAIRSFSFVCFALSLSLSLSLFLPFVFFSFTVYVSLNVYLFITFSHLSFFLPLLLSQAHTLISSFFFFRKENPTFLFSVLLSIFAPHGLLLTVPLGCDCIVT